MPVKRWMLEAAGVLIALAVFGYMLTALVGMQNMTLPGGQPMFGDYTAFWSAGRAALDGQADQVHNRAVTEAYQRLAAPDVRFFAPWNSPPTFLLICSLLALMPYPVSAVVFLIATLTFFLFAARMLLPDSRALVFFATPPSVIYHAGTVQAGLLNAGITGLALHWLDRRPRLAGAFVALLAIKPHLAIVWPVFLALSGRWRAFVSAAAATLGFVVVAGLVFGFESYLRFIANLSESQSLISAQQITTPAYASLYANLLGLDVPNSIAMAAHILSAALALAAACWIFLKRDRVSGGLALCASTLLISPYLFFYDFLILTMGAALLGKPRDRFELLAVIFAWGSGLTVAVGYYISLPICPLAAWLALIAAMRRAGNAAPLPAPAPQP